MPDSPFLISPQSKLLFIGDSITDCGRARPVGEGLFGAHGTGYVNVVCGLLGSVYPEHGIRIVNQGCSGDTVRDLKKRWSSDVTSQKPDWLAIMIGINDVWRQFDCPTQPEIHVLIDEYRSTLSELIEGTLPNLKGLVLMTPFYIETARTDAMRATMDAYGAVVRELAQKYGAIYVDTQAAFDKVLDHQYPAAIAWDRVHPNQIGTTILAKAFLDGIGFDWNR